jgi:predicted GIY-YIG superfamily endonuclease
MVVDNVLWYSEPFAYNWWDMARNFIPLSYHVRMVRSVRDGLYVGDEKGVYFLYDKCKLVYIGYSLNLHSRIKQHSCKSAIKVWDTAIYYRYKFANKKELLLIEKELIEFFKPSYNYQKWI